MYLPALETAVQCSASDVGMPRASSSPLNSACLLSWCSKQAANYSIRENPSSGTSVQFLSPNGAPVGFQRRF